MLSSESGSPATTVAGLKDNTLADGLVHAFTWIIVVGGLWVLWRRTGEWRWAASGRSLIGWACVGSGIFNVAEGLVNHEILGLHHVREGAGHRTAYDLGFLAFGALLILGGCVLARADKREANRPANT
jgi:uncharacterized membrane protein